MRSPEVPVEVLTFVSENLRNMEELQLMLTICQAPQRWWDARTAASELGIDEVAAGRTLDRLATLNLLDIRITDDVRYQFRPGTEELVRLARGCVDAYRSNPIALFAAVQPPARRGIRDFADAFRLRKPK